MGIKPKTHLVKLKRPDSYRLRQVISGSLLASGIATAIELLQLPTLSPSLTVALWAVAISAPVLAFDVVLCLCTYECGYVLEVFPRVNYDTVYKIACATALLVVAAVIHHFIPWATS